MHLFADETRKSILSLEISIGMAPKLLIASTMKVRPNSATVRPKSATGFTMPVEVSQWIVPKWVIAGMVVALPLLVATKVAASHSHNGAAVVRFLSPPRGRPRRAWPEPFTRGRS